MSLRRILHVDDDDDIRMIVEIALSMGDDFELKQCSNGQSAIAAAREFRPDLLLLDVMMPEMSGQDLRAEIAALPGLEDVATIFVTAKAEDCFTRELRSDGALDVITKPFDPMTLAGEISDIWERSGEARDFRTEQLVAR